MENAKKVAAAPVLTFDLEIFNFSAEHDNLSLVLENLEVSMMEGGRRC